MSENTHNLVLIGDGYVGKTSIFDVIQEKFNTESVPTVYNEFVFEKTVDDTTTIRLKLIDTAGQEEFDQLRRNVYREANIFLLCFCVTDRTSYENILSKWIKDIDDYRSTPIILIGTKLDLKTDNNSLPDGKVVRLQKKIGAHTYIECSAKNHVGFDKIIEAAIKIICNEETRENKKSCAIQ